MRLAARTICMVALGTPLSAQYAPRIVHPAVQVPGPQAARDHPPVEEFVLRGVVGAGIGLVGAFVGGTAGHFLLSPCDGCDDPGFAQAALGVMVGWTLGSGLGASLPNLGARCAPGSRRWSGIGGAIGGLVLALGLFSLIDIDDGATAATVVALPPAAAAAMVTLCAPRA